MGKNAFLVECTFSPLSLVLESTLYSVYDSAFIFFCHAKPTCNYAFLEEKELYPATISLPIGVPFSGSGFNGVFLCVLFM